MSIRGSGFLDRAAAALLGAALSSGALAQPHAATSPAGRWRTIDDRTGQAKSIVRIVETNGELQGTIETIFSPPAPSPNPLCDKCSGELKNKPVVGMRILWGLKRNGNEYTGGRVIDPEEGKTYRCKLKLVDGGRKLELRGYIGVSALGRTQTWLRE